MNKRKLIAGLLALTMTASLCGCGAAKTEPETAAESVTADSSAAETEDAAADAAEQDSSEADPELAEIKKIADAFFKELLCRARVFDRICLDDRDVEGFFISFPDMLFPSCSI